MNYELWMKIFPVDEWHRESRGQDTQDRIEFEILIPVFSQIKNKKHFTPSKCRSSSRSISCVSCVLCGTSCLDSHIAGRSVHINGRWRLSISLVVTPITIIGIIASKRWPKLQRKSARREFAHMSWHTSWIHSSSDHCRIFLCFSNFSPTPTILLPNTVTAIISLRTSSIQKRLRNIQKLSIRTPQM